MANVNVGPGPSKDSACLLPSRHGGSLVAAGARTLPATVPGSNRFDVILPLADPASAMTEALVASAGRRGKVEAGAA